MKVFVVTEQIEVEVPFGGNIFNRAGHWQPKVIAVKATFEEAEDVLKTTVNDGEILEFEMPLGKAVELDLAEFDDPIDELEAIADEPLSSLPVFEPDLGTNHSTDPIEPVYVIHKTSREPGSESYNGPTWDQAGIRDEYRLFYFDKEKAEKLAEKLSNYNPVGFKVSEAT